jgi:hypothetical protein
MFWLCSKMHLWSWGHDYLGQPALEKHVVVIFFKHISCVQGSFKSTFHNQTWLYRPLCQHTHAVFRMWPQGSSIRKTRKTELAHWKQSCSICPRKTRVLTAQGLASPSDNWGRSLPYAVTTTGWGVSHCTGGWGESSLVFVTLKLMRAAILA